MSVIERLKKHILVDGFHVVVDPKKSHGSWIVDKETGKEYLDCYSQFASQALGWNHPGMEPYNDKIRDISLYKIANSDMYTEEYADFVEEFASVAHDFKYFFFIDGGALGVENALKAAFDWKSSQEADFRQRPELMQVLCLTGAFHGRTGYTMSLTNTDRMKTAYYPQFNWTKIGCPSVITPADITADERENVVLKAAIEQLRKGNVAALIMEPIQGEGGDNHFRPEFVQQLRRLCDMYNAMLIFDEVQTGLGLTGMWWAHQWHAVRPDMMCFGKKTQVCGFCSTDKIDSHPMNVFKQSGRINSTWGGNIVDMVRATAIIKVIKEEQLLMSVMDVGYYFRQQLNQLKIRTNKVEGGSKISNIRGQGLMLALDCENTDARDGLVSKLQENMLVLKSGTKSIRFRPALTFSKQDVDTAIEFLEKALA